MSDVTPEVHEVHEADEACEDEAVEVMVVDEADETAEIEAPIIEDLGERTMADFLIEKVGQEQFDAAVRDTALSKLTDGLSVVTTIVSGETTITATYVDKGILYLATNKTVESPDDDQSNEVGILAFKHDVEFTRMKLYCSGAMITVFCVDDSDTLGIGMASSTDESAAFLITNGLPNIKDIIALPKDDGINFDMMNVAIHMRNGDDHEIITASFSKTITLSKNVIRIPEKETEKFFGLFIIKFGNGPRVCMLYKTLTTFPVVADEVELDIPFHVLGIIGDDMKADTIVMEAELSNKGHFNDVCAMLCNNFNIDVNGITFQGLTLPSETAETE